MSAATDHLGDALPQGAVQRLGTRRMQGSFAGFFHSSDGNRAYAISGSELQVWDLARGELLAADVLSNAALTAIGTNRSVSQALIATGDGDVIEWDLGERREIHRFATARSRISTIEYSPDESRVLTNDLGSATAEEWEKESGKKRVAFSEAGERFDHAIYSADGKTAFVSHQPGNTIYHIDLETGDVLNRFIEDYCCYDLCLSEDGERLLVGTRHMANEWQTSDYKGLETFSGHHGHAAPSVAYARDDTHLLTGSRDGSIRLWDRHKAEVVRRWYPHQRAVSRMRVSPDGEWVLSYGGDHLLTETSLKSGEPKIRWDRHVAEVRGLAFTPDGKKLISVSADRSIRLWDTGSWTCDWTILSPGDEAQDVAVSTSGDRFAAACKDGTAGLFSIDRGDPLGKLEGHNGYVRGVGFAGDGILTNGDDGTVRLWKESAAVALEEHLGGVVSQAVSPDGKGAVTGGRDGTIVEWDILQSKAISRAIAHRGWVHALAWLPNGRSILSGGGDGLLIEWNLEEGREVRAYDAGCDVLDIGIMDGGERFCSGGEDGRILVWDRASGRIQAALEGHEGSVTCLALSPVENTLVTGSADSTILVWKLD